MKLMGSKIASRAAVQKAGVPIVPGTTRSLRSREDALKAAAEIGYPVMLKASGGGGGKGLRLVSNEEELTSLYETAGNEAQASFNDSTLLIEKYLMKPRHIEIQILGDLEGNVIHLGERECSIQRRHQKLVEESPSPLEDVEFRRKIGEAAVTVAQTAHYHNAGTVEFIVEPATRGENKFYFLEMNTRLQVEHPVTEMVTCIDLVAEQIRIASGSKLAFRQEDIQSRGVAMECRIYAEDPYNQFFPSPGTLSTYIEPSGPGIRIDSGVGSGSTIPMEYDPLISKVISYGENRQQAILRMQRALGEYKIGGVRTTIPFFQLLLSHPAFIEADLHTHFIDDHQLIKGLEEESGKSDTVALIAAALDHFYETRRPKPRVHRKTNPWRDARHDPDPYRKWGREN
jgi:acetyl/propionyl-CoA carboxylase alpha subunit